MKISSASSPVFDIIKLICIAIFLLGFAYTSFGQQNNYPQNHVNLQQAAAVGVNNPTKYYIQTINKDIQIINIEKRILKLTLDMGDIYNLGINKTWAISLQLKLSAMTKNNTIIQNFSFILNTSESKPEASYFLDYSSLDPKIEHFDISVIQYSNSMLYAQNVVRFYISTIDEVAYSTLYRTSSEIQPIIDKVIPIPPATGTEVSNVKFKWSTPTNTYFPSFDLQVLKVEPNSDNTHDVVLDWSRSAKIEVNSGLKEYSMTLAEGTGYYFWRVRGIGSYYPGGRSDVRNFGSWSISQPDGIYYPLGDLYSSFSNGNPVSNNAPINGLPEGVAMDYFYYEQFNDNINWSYNKVLTEGSRVSETMTFANGLNQSSQIQTKLFSQNQIIGSQTVYDYSGHPALRSLIAPFNNDQLAYNSDLFKNQDGTRPLSAVDIDDDPSPTKPLNDAYLDVSPLGESGINSYYSGTNALGIKGNLVPDAKGFPYSRTLYYSDATGRVQKQSSPGKDMRLIKSAGLTHSQTTLYGAVAQDELDYVFGSEAPLDTTVYKVVSIDPNRVTNVSYVSKAGQTIATCLSNSGTLLNLESISSSSERNITSVFPKGKITPGNNFSTTSKTLVLDKTTTITVDYSLTPASFSITCAEDVCYSCDYRVEISITCPQDPDEPFQNVTMSFIVPPAQLANCNSTQTPITLTNLTAANNKSLSGPGTIALATLSSAGQVTLDAGTYIIDKKVYVNNQNSTGTPYIDEKVAELNVKRDTWTKDNNCDCPVAINSTGFKCNEEPDCGNAVFKASLYDILKKEKDNATYRNKLTNPTTLSVSFSESDLTDKIGIWMANPYYLNCSQIEACFKTYEVLLDKNIKLSSNVSDPDFKPELDFLQSVYDCIGYDPDPETNCKQYLNVVMYGDANANAPGTIRVWYQNLSGLPAGTAPTPITSMPKVKDVQIPDANGKTFPDDEPTRNAAYRANSCISMYKYPSPYTDGMFANITSDSEREARKKAWLAERVCECIKESTPPEPPPTQEVYDEQYQQQKTDIVNKCTTGCDSKRLSFIQSIDNYVSNINFSAGRKSPSDAGWQNFATLFPNQSKNCMAELMVQQCKEQCQMPYSSNIDPDKMDPNSPNYDSNYPDKQIVEKEQLEYEQAMNWNAEFKRIGSYKQAGDFSVVKDEILLFIEKSLGTAINNKNYGNRNLGSGATLPLYAVSLQTSPLSGNADYVYQHEEYEFTLIDASGNQGIPGVAVTNLIWDKSASKLLEMNVAIYCSGSSSPHIKWVYTPTYPCPYFEGFNNPSIRSLNDIVKFYIDKQGRLHAVMPMKNCLGTISTTDVCTTDELAHFSFTVGSGSSNQNLNISIGTPGNRVDLTEKPVLWNESGTINTASDITSFINNYISSPDYRATNLDANGAPSPLVTIFIYPGVGDKLQNLRMLLSGSMAISCTINTPAAPENTINSISTKLSSCSKNNPLTEICPYGFLYNESPPIWYPENGRQRYSWCFGDVNYRVIQDVNNNYPQTLYNVPPPDYPYGGVSMYYNSDYTLQPGPDYGCIGQGGKNPVWYAQTISQAGAFETSVQNDLGIQTGIIVWGPFTSATDGVCSSLTADKIIGCNTNSTINGEIQKVTIPNAKVNDIYITLIVANSQGNCTQQAGNCIRFLSKGTARVHDLREASPEIHIYPNSAGCSSCMHWSKPSVTNIIEFTNEDPVKIYTCEELKQKYEDNQAGTQLDACLTDRIQALRAGYKNNCLNKINDKLTISYSYNYDHYTLYYYDRAKNLIKTVPPAGVEFVDATQMTAVRNQRSNPEAYPNVFVPTHRLATNYTYNSIKQLIKQVTPDGGTTEFWYNALGQLVLSQDAGQNMSFPTLSYTLYDKLGRVQETGATAIIVQLPGQPSIQEMFWNADADYLKNRIPNKQNVVHIQYSTPEPSLGLNYKQHHLRNRISKTWTDNDNNGQADAATYYSYDPHGNVEFLIQELPGIGRKVIRYEYDLVSGNVNKVYYNENTPEQFIHKYIYDADNRINQVYTSTDGMQWERDAEYQFYAHGPLARTMLGEDRIQGTDYVYTIDGYLKSINQAELEPTKDPGADLGAATGYLKDEFAMELGYYENDYDRTGSNIGKAGKDPYTANIMTKAANSLYNGNISYWMSNTRDGTSSHASNAMGLKMNIYKYDQLNRLKTSTFHESVSGVWQASDGRYNEGFNYDGNGNITSLTRKAYGEISNLDNLEFKYNRNPQGKILDNRLYHVDEDRPSDPPPSPGFKVSIEDQGTFNSNSAQINYTNNYRYHPNGNLYKDISEDLTINWNNMNKITLIQGHNEITRGEGDNITITSEPYEITFMYDAQGNRIQKKFQYENSGLKEFNHTTYYIRDASGNIMAVYSKKYHTAEDVTEYKLLEIPIYGSSRIGEYQPNLVVATMSGYVEDVSGSTSPINPDVTAMQKWLVPTVSGLKLVDFTGANPVTSLAGNITGSIAKTALTLGANNSIALAAYAANNTSSEWKLVNSTFSPISTPFTIPAEIRDNSGALIIKKPGSASNYYFVYQAGGATDFKEIRYIELDVSGAGSVIGSSELTIPGGITFGRKLIQVNYADGNTRIFAYSNSPDNTCLIYTIDVTPTGIQAPVVRYGFKNGNSPVNAGNDMAISPDGKNLAITSFNANGNNDIALFKIDLSSISLSAPQFYNAASGKAKHVEFSPAGIFLYYSAYNGPSAAADIGRISLGTGTINGVTSLGTGSVDLQRSYHGTMIMNPNSSSSLLIYINTPDETVIGGSGTGYVTYVIDAEALLADGISQQGTPVPYNMSVPQIAKFSEFNNWVVATKIPISYATGMVDLKFKGAQPVEISNTSRHRIAPYHNVAVAENANGELELKFVVGPNEYNAKVTFLFNAINDLVSSSVVNNIYADDFTKSIFVKVPGQNGNYYLITGYNGQLYYHLIEKSSSGQFIVQAYNINKPLQFGLSLQDLKYDQGKRQFALAAYNDTRSAYANRLIVAVRTVGANQFKYINIYQHSITENGIESGTSLGKTWSSNPTGTAELGEMHISPNFDALELALSVTELDPAPLPPPSKLPVIPADATKPPVKDIKHIKFFDGAKGVAVGQSGLIISMTNGGKTWQEQLPVTTANLNHAYFTSTSDGYVAGDAGTLLRTSNGGSTWTSLTTGVSDNLKAVRFYYSSSGIALSDNGKIIRTIDGGTTWTTLPQLTTESLNAAFFISYYRGYIVGNNGTILKSTDGGATWALYHERLTTDNLKAIKFSTPDVGYILTEHSGILQTINGGDTWTLQPIKVSVETNFANVAGVTSPAGGEDVASFIEFNEKLNAMDIAYDGTMYVAGDEGTILKSIDGGALWENELSTSKSNLTSVSVKDEGDLGGAYFGGDTTTILYVPNPLAASADVYVGYDANTVYYKINRTSPVPLPPIPEVPVVEVPDVPIPVDIIITAPTNYMNALKRIDAGNQNQIVQVLNSVDVESEIRRGANYKMYLNQQLPAPGRNDISAGGNTEETEFINVSSEIVPEHYDTTTNGPITTHVSTTVIRSSGEEENYRFPFFKTSSLGGDQSVKTPQRHKHSIKLFSINPVNMAIAYKGEKFIEHEQVAQSEDAKVTNKVITFDYSPTAQYIYYVQRTVTTYPATATNDRSKLIEFSNPEAATVAQVTQQSLSLGTGPSNFGLPLQPTRIYEIASLPIASVLASNRVINKRVYELSDHLGNVRATLADYREWQEGVVPNNTVDDAENVTVPLSWADYYAFGALMPGRQFNSPDYRYGFGGHEKVDEVSGSGNTVDMGDRWLDVRLGRTPKPDINAVKYPAVSPYSYALNNPINVVDRDGKDAVYIAFPSYKADGYPMTGHAGVLLIDNKTGLTKYYEYGRYDKPQLGVVNSYAVSNVIIGADGRPTAESLNKVLKQISDKSGKGKEIEGAYIESDKFKEMNDYAQDKMKENTDPKREPYSITGNNCGTFACDVIEQDKTLDTPTIIDPRPVSIIDEYQDEFTPVTYDPKQGTTIKYEKGTVKSSDKPAPKKK